MNDSTSAFCLGHSGVPGLNSIPHVLMYVSISILLNGGPLSHVNLTETPCAPKIPWSFGMILPAAVDLTISTSGNRLYVSMTDSKYSPESTGPKKSILLCAMGVVVNLLTALVPNSNPSIRKASLPI